MNQIDIQASAAGTYDVLINGDHHETVATRDDAYASARAAAGTNPRVTIRDFTTMGEGRTQAMVPFAIVER